MGDIIQSLKEFIWDIVGYMIPGFLLIIVFNLLMQPKYGLDNSFLIDWKIFGEYLPIVISYVIGYIVYSVTILKITIQDSLINQIETFNNYISRKCIHMKTFLIKIKIPKIIFHLIISSHSKFWLKSACRSASFNAAKDFLKTKNYQEVDSMKYNEIRNILMSRNPEMDQKVYTFMFRASLFDQISTVAIFAILIYSINYFFNLNYVKNESLLTLSIYILIFLVPLLGKCKRVFYSISQRIPISNLK